MACTSCGSECGGTSCSMCYGDPYHGDDGYYLDYLEQAELTAQREAEEACRLSEEEIAQMQQELDDERSRR